MVGWWWVVGGGCTKYYAVDVEYDVSYIRVAFRYEHIEAECRRHTANKKPNHSESVDEVRLTSLAQLQSRQAQQARDD